MSRLEESMANHVNERDYAKLEVATNQWQLALKEDTESRKKLSKHDSKMGKVCLSKAYLLPE